jgi:hypothetical protein
LNSQKKSWLGYGKNRGFRGTQGGLLDLLNPPHAALVARRHVASGDRRMATSRGLTGWWATGVPDRQAQRWLIGRWSILHPSLTPVLPRSIFLQIRGAPEATRGEPVWPLDSSSPSPRDVHSFPRTRLNRETNFRPPCPTPTRPRLLAACRATPRSIQPGSGAPPAIFIHKINRRLIGSDRIGFPHLAPLPFLPPERGPPSRHHHRHHHDGRAARPERNR